MAIFEFETFLTAVGVFGLACWAIFKALAPHSNRKRRLR
jgi:hypothetical protein